ncbi:MAG: N-acetylmuramoyl-L-alanine amidase family protein [Carboxydocellales bacterium]
MAKLIAIDDGHGPETLGKQTPVLTDGKVIHENQFNAPTALLLEAALKRCGFRTMQAAPENTDVPLGTRIKRANDAKAEGYVSIHYNALRGFWDETAGGVSTHYQPGSVEGQKLAACVQKYVAQGTPQVNRGIVAQNLAVTRETKMVAVLVENGFMDVHKEADLMLDPKFQKEQAEQIAQGVCEYFGVTYVPPVKEAPPKDELAEAVGALLRAGVISSPEYWQKVARPGQKAEGENVAALIIKMAKKIGGK